MTSPASEAIVEPVRGKFYFLKGGKLLRSHGRYPPREGRREPFPDDPGKRIGSYSPPSSELSDTPGGYSAYDEDVIREITVADLEWLRERKAKLLAFTPPMVGAADGVEAVIVELTGAKS